MFIYREIQRLLLLFLLSTSQMVCGQFKLNSLKIIPKRSSRLLSSTDTGMHESGHYTPNRNITHSQLHQSTSVLSTHPVIYASPKSHSTQTPEELNKSLLRSTERITDAIIQTRDHSVKINSQTHDHRVNTNSQTRDYRIDTNSQTRDHPVDNDNSDSLEQQYANRIYTDDKSDQLSSLLADDIQSRTNGRSNELLYTGRSSWDRVREVRRKSMNMTRVEHIEAECQDDFMRIIVHFNGSFTGLIYSAGYAYDPSCIYINGTGRGVYEFLIQLNRCGTLGGNNQRDVEVRGRDIPAKNFMWNTVSIQYNALIEEEWDEHFKVTCEYGYDIWKTVTFPFLDVETQTGNPVVFTLSPPECYMEIRYGYGTTGNRITGPVRVGDPLTLIIYMRSQYDGFDIVVSDCYAHNGADKKITLVDHYGCPVDEKLISPFQGTWSDNGIFETQVYAYMKTFRFTGSPALYVECDVRMCHGACPTQPCHWRRTKRFIGGSSTVEQDNDIHHKQKRSLDDKNHLNTNDSSIVPTSQSISLYQSLQVLQDEENSYQAKLDVEKNELHSLQSDQVCFNSSVLVTSASLSLSLFLIAAMFLCLMYFRVKISHKHADKISADYYTGQTIPSHQKFFHIARFP